MRTVLISRVGTAYGSPHADLRVSGLSTAKEDAGSGPCLEGSADWRPYEVFERAPSGSEDPTYISSGDKDRVSTRKRQAGSLRPGGRLERGARRVALGATLRSQQNSFTRRIAMPPRALPKLVHCAGLSYPRALP